MSCNSNSGELREEIYRRTVNKYGIIEVPSDEAEKLVERVVALDSSGQSLLEAIELLASALPQDEHFPTRLTTLFNKAVSVGSYGGERLIHGLFYRNPDVLAEPLIDFVRGDPMGERQTKLLTDIFYPVTLSQHIGDFSPQMVQGLKRAAAGIDNLRTERGFGHIVRLVVDSVAFKKDADKQYETLFPS